MSKSARAAAAMAVCATAALPALAQAAKHKAAGHMVTITNRVITLSSGGGSSTNVGTSDGHIGGGVAHGALRAVVSGPSGGFTAVGTLFYPAGTLNYISHGKLTLRPDGSTSDTGTFQITGGTGRYAGAHGSLNSSGVFPTNAPSFSYTATGKITYR